MRFLCTILAFALAACGRADASTTDLPTLTVQMQADSARVIATWRRPCDAKGCADTYAVRWSAGSNARTRTLTVLADTFFVTRPAVGDSTLVSVVVTSLRRGITGASRTATAVVRNPDAPPPAVDSLRTDTLSALAAEIDSLPSFVYRDTLGRSAGEYRVGDTFPVCALARHRYTGEIRVMVEADASEEREAYLERICERARQSYAAERAG